MRLNKELIDKGIDAMTDVLNGMLVIEAGNKIGHNGQWVRTFIQFFLYTAHDSKRFIMPRRPRLYDMREYSKFWLSIIPEVREMLYKEFPNTETFDYKSRQIQMAIEFTNGRTCMAIAKKNSISISRAQKVITDLFHNKLTGFPMGKPLAGTVRRDKAFWLAKIEAYSLTTKEKQ